MFPLSAVVSAITDWVMVGGCPLIPHAFVASIMRSYASIYAEFVVHGLTFHYVTASPTNAVGDVMFYVNKDRGAALLDTTNTNFMSVVLSDPHTVLGPLWHNHSATYRPVFKTYPTSILNGEDIRTQGPGELFMYMKTSAGSTLGSAGYVLVDFDISFLTLQVNPRELSFPLTRLKYNQYGINFPTGGIVAGTAWNAATNGARTDGTTSYIYSDSATKQGDVFKVVLMPDYGQYNNISAATLTRATMKAGGAAFTNVSVNLDDGYTVYAVLYAPPSDGVTAGVLFYPSYDAAMAQSVDCLEYAQTGTVTYNIPAWWSLVGNVNPALYQSNY